MKHFTKLLVATLLLFFTQSYSQQDQNVNQIINSVDLNSLSTIVKELSGDVQTTIKGTPTTILSRYASEPGNISAADYIEQKLTSYGYTVVNQDNGATCRNVYATLTGSSDPQQKYIICAHYDSQINSGPKSPSPGADDNASGVAAVLEAARILKNYSPKYTIVFALLDEEELGLFGSRLYISKQGPNTIGVINMDMIGYDSDGDYKVDLHVRNVADSPKLATTITSTNTLYALGVLVNVVNPGTDASDQYSFWESGYSAIGLIENDQDFSTYYHMATDQFNKMNTEYFFRCAKLGIGTLAALALPTTDGGTDVAALEETPKNFSLSQNFPNPFNPNTTINYSVFAVGRNSISTNKVVVKVYDLLGSEVATLVNEEKAAGNYQVKFDGTNMPSGVYFYRIQAADFIQTKKMILLK